MKVALALGFEAAAVFVFSNVLEDTAATLGLIAATLIALGVIGRAIHKTYRLWREVSKDIRSAVHKINALDDEGLRALQALPDWSRGFEFRLRALEDRIHGRKRAS